MKTKAKHSNTVITAAQLESAAHAAAQRALEARKVAGAELNADEAAEVNGGAYMIDPHWLGIWELDKVIRTVTPAFNPVAINKATLGG